MIEMDQQPIFLSLCDKESKMVNNLRNSVRGNLIAIETYDKTLKNLSKLFCMHAFLKNDTSIPDNHIIVFTDAHDVLCMRYDKEQIVNDFISKGKDIIIGAEPGFSHHCPTVKQFFDTKYRLCKNKYLNSGFIIAYKWAYVKMLDHIVENYNGLYETPNRTSDQRVLSKFMVYNQDLQIVNIDIDTESKFVFNYTSMVPSSLRQHITAYFVHVTDLKSPSQLAKYQNILHKMRFH